MAHLTAAQHYRQAEFLLDQAEARIVADDGTKSDWFAQGTAELLLVAQVHATLAAASALSQTETRDPGGPS